MATTTTTISHGSNTDMNDDHKRLEMHQKHLELFYIQSVDVFGYHHHISNRGWGQQEQGHKYQARDVPDAS